MSPKNVILLVILLSIGAIVFWGVGRGAIGMDSGVPEPKSGEFRKLTAEEAYIIEDKGTEAPFSGKYNDFYEEGTYHCKRCDAPLYRSDHKFASSCGWPSFDDEVETSVKKVPDADGRRTEIVCANCGAHLGHIFEGEGFTLKNLRHCVNSLSLIFKPDPKPMKSPNDPAPNGHKYAYFAGGCFWGVEHLFQTQDGVISAVSGYMGGTVENPTYQEVIRKNTGHYEVVRIEYDPSKTDYETLSKFFFEIHDPTQANGQGPDIGSQYLSVIFYADKDEKKTAESLIQILKNKGYDVVTKVEPEVKFWEAEDYHQDYYERKGSLPYCHSYQKKF